MGRPGSIVYGNQTSTVFDYDPINRRLSGINVLSPTQGLLINTTYGYDNKGNITGINDLLNKPQPTNFYSETYTPVRAHALDHTGSGRTFHYDPNGNITNDGTKDIIYNYDNMPTTVGNVSFTYDGNGSRVIKDSPGATTLYVDKLYECTNGHCVNYIFAGNQRIALKSSNQTLYYHPDHQGSTSVVTDVNGNNIEEVSYFPFGQTRQKSGPVTISHMFTGQELDYESNLYNYNARLYDPDLGRFLTPDSIVPDPSNPQSLNRYSYVLNNPLNLVDPTGNISTTLNCNAGVSPCGSNQNQYQNSYQNQNSPDYSVSGDEIAAGFEDFGDSIVKASHDVGDFFDGLFGGGGRKEGPFFRRGDPPSRNSGYNRNNNGRQVRATNEIKFPLIYNFIEPSSNPISDAEMAFNLLPIASVGKATHLVYYGFNKANIIKYIGITGRDAAVRWSEHLKSIGSGKEFLRYDVFPGATELTKLEAKIIEQMKINLHSLPKNGGQLLNQINSISPKFWQKYGISKN